MKDERLNKASKKTDRLEAIEIADERTERPAHERERDVGAETEGGAGATSTPAGDGNSLRSGDTDVALNTGFKSD